VHADARQCSYPGKNCSQGDAFRKTRNIASNDGNSSENTKGTIDGENFPGGRGKAWDSIETDRLAERI